MAVVQVTSWIRVWLLCLKLCCGVCFQGPCDLSGFSGGPRTGGHPTVSHQAEVWAPVTLFIKGQVPVQQSMLARVRFAPNVAIIQSRPECWTHWRALSSPRPAANEEHAPSTGPWQTKEIPDSGWVSKLLTTHPSHCCYHTNRSCHTEKHAFLGTPS